MRYIIHNPVHNRQGFLFWFWHIFWWLYIIWILTGTDITSYTRRIGGPVFHWVMHVYDELQYWQCCSRYIREMGIRAVKVWFVIPSPSSIICWTEDSMDRYLFHFTLRYKLSQNLASQSQLSVTYVQLELILNFRKSLFDYLSRHPLCISIVASCQKVSYNSDYTLSISIISPEESCLRIMVYQKWQPS